MDILLKYFPELTKIQIEQYSKLESLYGEWNSRINVISRKDIDSLYIHHVLHSLSIARIVQFVSGSAIIDVGTGGGFPGIPLAIRFPSSNFTLVDSIGKKIKVVQEISREVGLKNVNAINARAEEITDRFDFVVSRAVKSFPEFYPLVKNKILKESKNSIRNGILYLKGGDVSSELKSFRNRAVIYPIKDYFTEEYFRTKLVIYISF